MSEAGKRGARIRAFLLAACGHARRRAAAAGALDVLLLGATLAFAAVLLAFATQRGDVLRLGWIWGAIGFATVRLGWALRYMRVFFRDDLAAARAIAATRGPLRRPVAAEVADARLLRADRLLRHEVLAAVELAAALEEIDNAEAEAPIDRVAAAAVGSTMLAERYIVDVERRVSDGTVDPRFALPRPSMRRRALALVGIATAFSVTLVASGSFADGLGLLIAGVDARPPVPPEPVWSTMSLQLDYPQYTMRPRRVVPNPSGALRVPAGTQVAVNLTARRPAASGRLVVTYDSAELAVALPPELYELTENDDVSDVPGMKWQGSFTSRGSGTWTLILLDDDDDAVADATRRSAALPLSQEPDRAPEIELLPLPRERREVRESDSVDIRFTARDDFGLAQAQLVYQLPDGTAHRLPIAAPPNVRARRGWRGRYTWDISQIPISERSEVLYWVEIRDNDPGLGLVPLADPPGKATRSATLRLVIRDDEAEHAQNIMKLQEIRDFAVDLLALRMQTRAFETVEQATELGRVQPPVNVRAAMSRDLMARSGELLAHLSTAIDALSMDSLAHERDVATLTKVHGRLMELHRAELALHEVLPPRIEVERPDDAERALAALEPHNGEEVSQLEDEIIRLDDLVHGEIIERLEALVARLEATQRKLVDLLEQLRAGDESVRSQIEQLEQRRREDLRRIAEARAMLSQEVEQEFMNLDAFEILQKMQKDEELAQMLSRGEVDQALERAQQQLGEIQGLRDQVQQRLGESGPGPELSEEDKKRMQLLRELSRLQDEEGTLRGRTSTLHERWREAVAGEKAGDEDRTAAAEYSAALKEALEKINDARLGREGRRGLEDALEEVERLSELAGQEQPSALDLAESAERIDDALRRAVDGSEERESEGKALRRAHGKSGGIRERLMRGLPSPGDALPAGEHKQLAELEAQQRGLDKRAQGLLDDPISDLLPPEGRQAMRRARKGMGAGADRLDALRPGEAVAGEQRAWDAIQEAIDSLRKGPPPPQSAASGDASTEAERDRSLRDELMDAMREDAPAGFADPVERYYEELLR